MSSFNIHDVVQRSPEWVALRIGRLCSSTAYAVFATRKDKHEAAPRRDLRLRLVLERITGRSMERSFQSQAMSDGIEREADALLAYESLTGRLTQRLGFITHPSMMIGGSPDGVIGNCDGIAEAKCPTEAIHLDYLRTGIVPENYRYQCLHLLYLTGAKWCDWFSYQPNFPERIQMKLVRIERDEQQMRAYGLALMMFLKEVDDELGKVEDLAEAHAGAIA